MSAINPIGPSAPRIISPQKAGAETKAGFDDLLRNCVNQVDKNQQNSASAIRELMAGDSQDILPVVAAAAKADMSFKLLIGVRNKVIEAYKQTMNMQV